MTLALRAVIGMCLLNLIFFTPKTAKCWKSASSWRASLHILPEFKTYIRSIIKYIIVCLISERSSEIGAFRSCIASMFRQVVVILAVQYYCTVLLLFCFYREHPRFRNFNPTIPVDVIRVKSNVDSFLDSTCVPVRNSINKLDLVPNRIVAGLVGVFRNGGGLGTGDLYIPVLLFDHLLHESSCFWGTHWESFRMPEQ